MDPSENTTMIKEFLKVDQNVVNDQFSLAEDAWSTHQAKIVHSLRFTPREAWASVTILSGGMMSYQEKPPEMRPDLPTAN